MRAHVRRKLYALVLVSMVTAVIVLKRAHHDSPKHHSLTHARDYGEQVAPEALIQDIDIEQVEESDVKQGNEDAKTTEQTPELHAKGQNFLIDSSGCQIPDMKPFSSVAKEHSQPPKPLHCGRRVNKYRVNRALDEDYVSGEPVLRAPPPGLDCCYTHVKRRSRDDSQYKYTQNCMPVDKLLAPELASDSEEARPEFVRVSCRQPSQSEEWINEEYVDLHAFVPLKDEVEWRCDQAPKEEDQVNLVILGIDSVSRLNMIRQLPETLKLLTSPPLSSTILLGYNKVADNTFPNLMPVLMGHSVEELPEACGWGSSESGKFDNCPLIWKAFAEKGFRTMYAEECPHLATFNFQKKGFIDPPTDYYPRPLFLAASDEVGHTHADNCILCLGRQTSVATLMDYTSQFVRRFSGQRHFSFSWATSLTHDGLNMAGLADPPFASTVRGMVTRGDLKRTVLITLSDHGVRTGDFRLTPQGRLEERLPFVSFSFPEWFHHRYPTAMANFKLNAKSRLTTPFDIHETLRDLVSPAALMNSEVIKNRMLEMRSRKTQPRGISLFQEIPEDRDCESAGIPRHWCTCLSYRPLSLDDPGLKDAADALVSHINERFLAPHAKDGCVPLSLVRVLEARLGTASLQTNSEQEFSEEETPNAGIKDYALTIETHPGGAFFEGAVRSYKRRGRTNKSRVRFEVADSISRLNRYGNQSACVSDWVVKLYCYCE